MQSLSHYISQTLKQLDMEFHGEPIIGTVGGFPHCALSMTSDNFLFLIHYLSEDKNIYYELHKEIRHLLTDQKFLEQYEELFSNIKGKHWHYSCKNQNITYADLVFESRAYSRLNGEYEYFYHQCCRLGKDLTYCLMNKMQNDFIEMVQSSPSEHEKMLESFLFSNNPRRQQNLNRSVRTLITPRTLVQENSGAEYDLSDMFTPEFLFQHKDRNWLTGLDDFNRLNQD